MICLKHKVQMKKGKITNYCPICAAQTSGIGDNAETDKTMSFKRKFRYRGRGAAVIHSGGGQFQGYRKPSRKAKRKGRI